MDQIVQNAKDTGVNKAEMVPAFMELAFYWWKIAINKYEK